MNRPAVQFHVRPGDSLPDNVGTIINKARELFAWAQQFDPVFKQVGFRKLSVLGVDVVLDNNALAPRIIVGGVSSKKGGEIPSGGVYAPAIAYIPASFSFGDTFKLFNDDAVLVLHSDPRARSLVTQYYRYDKAHADAVLAPGSQLVEYKGRGFSISGSGTHFLAAILGDRTNATTLTAETGGVLYVASVSGSGVLWVRKVALPSSLGWKRMGGGSYPTVTLGAPLVAIADGRPRCFVDKKPWVCSVTVGVPNTLNIYRYRQEGEFAAGTLVASYSRNTQTAVNLTSFTTHSASTTTFIGDTDFSDSTDIRVFPSSQQLRVVSAPSSRPIPLAGTATRDIQASHNTTFTSVPVAAVNGGASGGAEYTISLTTEGVNRFVGDFDGAAIDTSETITYAMASSIAFSYDYALSGSILSGSSSQLGTHTITAEYRKKTLSCLFCDAAFATQVFLEKTFIVNYDLDQNINLQRTINPSTWGGDPPPTNGIPAEATATYYEQYPTPTAFPDPFDFMFGSFDEVVEDLGSSTIVSSYQDLREVVIVRDGVEILRQAYWDVTTAGLPSIGTYGGFPTIQPLYIAAHPASPESFELWGQRTARAMAMSLAGSISDDDGAVTCDSKGVYVEVVWTISGTTYRLFVDSTGDDWAAQSGVATGTASTASKLFRV